MKALLVIDMLEDFVRGKLKVEAATTIIPNIRQLVEAARRARIPVVYVCDAHEPGDPELQLWGPHAMKGTKGAQVVEELKPQPSDFIVEKKTYSGFFQTNLHQILQQHCVDTVVLTGLVTDICVQHTAADAFFRGYKVWVVRNATVAIDEESHQQALSYMARVYGARVVTTADMLQEFSAS